MRWGEREAGHGADGQGAKLVACCHRLCYTQAMETTKVRISYRVTPDCKRLIEAIARTLGISATAAIEVMAREKAQQLGIALTPKRQRGRS